MSTNSPSDDCLYDDEQWINIMPINFNDKGQPVKFIAFTTFRVFVIDESTCLQLAFTEQAITQGARIQ